MKRPKREGEGRPTKYTKELGDLICERISTGESVRSIERDENMPSGVTIYSWLLDEDKEEFLKHYSRARDTQAEVIFEEIIELADKSLEDIIGDDKSDSARVQARKLQIDARHWHLSKLRPKKYGDKLDLTSGGDKLPQPIINVNRDNSAKEDNEPQ